MIDHSRAWGWRGCSVEPCLSRYLNLSSPGTAAGSAVDAARRVVERRSGVHPLVGRDALDGTHAASTASPLSSEKR